MKISPTRARRVQTSHSPHAHNHAHAADHKDHGDDHHHHHHHDVNRHDEHIRSYCFAIDTPIAEASLNTWLEILVSFAGSNILRVKGIINVEGRAQPMVVHGVQHVFHPPVSLPAWPSDDRRSRLVFITHDIGKEDIENIMWVIQQPVQSAVSAD